MGDNAAKGAGDAVPCPSSLRSALLGAVRHQPDRGTPTSIELRVTHPESAFPTYRADLRFSGRADLSLFVKDLGARRRPVDQPVRHRECELDVYGRLLIGAELGTPRFVTEAPAKDGSHWLVLEFVDGTPLKWLDFEWWLVAAGWLGRKDAHFQARQGELAAVTSLRRFDEAHFAALGSQAMEAVHSTDPGKASSLAPIVEYCDEVVQDLTLGEWTLVHGSYRRAQVLVVTTSVPPRVCAVDWETAGYGSPLCDLASLCEGFESERLSALVGAYLDSVVQHGGVAPDVEDLCRAMRAHWICRQLRFVVKSFRRHWAERHLSRFIDAARACVRDHRRLRPGTGSRVGSPDVSAR